MYTNLLTHIKNAQAAKKEVARIPFSEMNCIIAELLAAHHYVESVTKRGRAPKRMIEVRLRYKDGEPAFKEIHFVSKPSRRIYIGYRGLRPVRQGYGLGVISTSQGIMTTKAAREKKLGGELLFELW